MTAFRKGFAGVKGFGVGWYGKPTLSLDPDVQIAIWAGLINACKRVGDEGSKFCNKFSCTRWYATLMAINQSRFPSRLAYFLEEAM